MSRAGSKLSFSRPDVAERFPVLLEIGSREVVYFVLLQKGVHLHSRFETKQPAKLRRGKGLGSVCFECQAFQRRTRQVLPPCSESLCDVFRQFQRDLHGDVLQSIISILGGFGHAYLKRRLSARFTDLPALLTRNLLLPSGPRLYQPCLPGGTGLACRGLSGRRVGLADGRNCH